MRDEPLIRCIEATGRPYWHKDNYPICPVCGSECDTFYKDRDGEIFGCEQCIETVDAWETI